MKCVCKVFCWNDWKGNSVAVNNGGETGANQHGLWKKWTSVDVSGGRGACSHSLY